MVHFFEQITCWEYIFMGFVVIDGFLVWTSNQQNTRLLRYKKEAPRFEPHLCQQLCRLCVTWWDFCTPKKGGDVRRVTFEVGSCFFLGGFPPSFFVEILYQQLQSARDWQTWAKMAPLRNKSEKSDYSFKSSNENKQLGRGKVCDQSSPCQARGSAVKKKCRNPLSNAASKVWNLILV